MNRRIPQEILRNKTLVMIYGALPFVVKDTDYHGEIRMLGDAVAFGNRDILVCDKMIPVKFPKPKRSTIEEVEFCCIVTAAQVLSELRQKHPGKAKAFACAFTPEGLVYGIK